MDDADGGRGAEPAGSPRADEAELSLVSPLQGTVVRAPEVGTAVRAGQPVVVVESMKMEHPIPAPQDGYVTGAVATGAPVLRDQVVARVRAGTVHTPAPAVADAGEDLLAALRARHEATGDAARTEQVQRRHATGGRTARENLAHLLDDGSFVELGGLALAAQRGRRSMQELLERTPADGVLTGFGTVRGTPVAVVAYDYTVLAGTQGMVGHRKLDRLFELAARRRTPVVLYAEGGGGRPGDTDHLVVSALDTRAFVLWAGLSGIVPRIAIVHGRCFAGNAALAGCADLVIATASTSWGMGGPAMIAGGGLGDVDADDVGPLATHVDAGTVDVAVADEAAATEVAIDLLGLLTRSRLPGACADQEALRRVVPADRRRAFDVHAVLDVLFDTGSVCELRPQYAAGMVTALARLDGRPVGVLANNGLHEAGAVTAEGAGKAARFLQLCDAFGLPVVSLVDTPGMMVGPQAEGTGLVRHTARLFVAGATLTVPFVAVVLRRAYGLGGQAMLAGGSHEPLLTLAWPTGELAPMGLQGAVRLGLRRELAALTDPAERAAEVARLTAWAQQQASAVNVASVFEIDDVIDPADTRQLLSAALADVVPSPGDPVRRRVVDTW